MRAAIVVAAAVILTATDAQSADPASEMSVLEAQIQVAGRNFERNGFSASGEIHTGQLESGASQNLDITLAGSREHVVVGVCDNACTNLDLYLRDDEGKEVAKDDSDDDVPVLDVSVGGSATYHLRVTMKSCGVPVCLYGFGIYSKTVGVRLNGTKKNHWRRVSATIFQPAPAAPRD